MTEPNPFVYRKATQDQSDSIQSLYYQCSFAYDFLLALPESRERALAITKLEECAMWAAKSIAFHQAGPTRHYLIEARHLNGAVFGLSIDHPEGALSSSEIQDQLANSMDHYLAERNLSIDDCTLTYNSWSH